MKRTLTLIAALICLVAFVSPVVWARPKQGKDASVKPAVAPVSNPAARSGDAPLYEPPAPGTYELPPIDRVSDHKLLGIDGKPASMLGHGPDEAAVVSFIYRSCTQATGCPLALAVMQRLDHELAASKSLADRVRLVTVTFDPIHDTPERMKALRSNMNPKCDWRFLTTSGKSQLDPILEDFGQDVVPLVTDEGEETGVIRHVMKVYLVDGAGDVRNIYSAGLFDERLLMNDLLTVLEPKEGRAMADKGDR